MRTLLNSFGLYFIKKISTESYRNSRQIKKLKKDYSDLDWHLSLAGDGQTFNDIERIIKEENLHENITLNGNINEEELITWFQELDIYAHATEGETLSTSMLQAMACGLPIIASDVPGVNNLISDVEEFGILVHEKSALAFSDAIVNLIKNTEKLKSMSISARNIAENRYSIKNMTSKYLDLVKELTSSCEQK